MNGSDPGFLVQGDCSLQHRGRYKDSGELGPTIFWISRH
jgi:hypothetical protein